MSAASDPTTVHPTHDQPTPDNLDDWSEEQLALYNTLKEQSLGADLAADRADEQAEHEQAAKLLVDAATEGAETAEINLMEGIKPDEEQPVTVKTYVPGDVERRLATISTLDESVEALVFALTTMIEAPEKFTRPKLWKLVYEQGGAVVLDSYLDNVLEPAGAVDSFRDE